MIYNTMKIELCNEKPNSTEHFYSSVWLPASDADIVDAYCKVRIITEPNANAEIRVTECPRLPELVGTRLDSPTIAELNFLAKRLGELSEDELTVLWAVKKKVLTGDEDDIVGMKDLINLTYGLDDVMVFPEIRNDEMLGEFVIENDLHPDVKAIPDTSLYLIDKEMIGKLHRENEGGAFVDGKYVFAGEYELPEVYDGSTLPDDKGELERWYAFRLEIVQPPEDEAEPEPTDDWLFLPADKMEIYAMKNKYGVERIEDCVYLGFESNIPGINDDDFGDMHKFEKLNSLAYAYMCMSPKDKVKFKAVLEAQDAHGVEKLLNIAQHISKYELDPSVENGEDYFKNYLSQHLDSGFDRRWLDSMLLRSEGRELLNRTNATITSYGAVSYYGCPLYENVTKYPEKPILDDNFEVIEVCGQKALFTNARIDASELPDGVYKYDLRDGVPFFSSIERYVGVDHAGTVLTREAIELGESGSIVFTEDTSPNFLGDEITLRDYLSAEFTEEETETQKMEGMTQ